MSENRYNQILEKLFFNHYKKGDQIVAFKREEIESTAASLGIKLPKNLGDLIYSFRFRTALPERIRKTATGEKAWVIKLAGKGLYKFSLDRQWAVEPREGMLQIKVPDATPGIIARYALDDEQALLAKVRYNRLVDIFSGVTSSSLQNHLRTTVPGLGQVEVDEIYVGVDSKGVQYVFPLQAKGGKDRLSTVQIEQDLALCAEKFPNLVCRPLGAQFLAGGGIALMEFVHAEEGLQLAAERHYRLVPPEDVTEEDLKIYSRMTAD